MQRYAVLLVCKYVKNATAGPGVGHGGRALRLLPLRALENASLWLSEREERHGAAARPRALLLAPGYRWWQARSPAGGEGELLRSSRSSVWFAEVWRGGGWVQNQGPPRGG